MSRVIKFRAWDFYLKQIVQPSEPILLNKIIPLLHGDNSVWKSKTDLSGYHLMQFTGLHDVNGVEIYESDVVEVLSDSEFAFNHEVKWHDEHGCYCIDAIHGCDYDYTTMPWAMDSQYYSYKVIVNIYQNPELLEPKS